MPNADSGRLTERNQAIWDGYVLQGKTLMKLAEEFDVSNQRISQILAEIRESLPETDRQAFVDLRVAQIAQGVNGLMPGLISGDKDAVASYVKLADREAKYLGLDAPTRTEVSGKIATYELPGVDMDAL